MTKLIDTVLKISSVQVFAEQTSNSILYKESANEIFLLIDKMKNSDLQKLKGMIDNNIFSCQMGKLLKNSFLMEKEKVPSFILQEDNDEYPSDFFLSSTKMRFFKRKALSDNVSKLVSYVLKIKDYEYAMPNILGNIKLSSLEVKFQESIADLKENRDVYLNNPRFDINKAIEMILNESPALNHEYVVIDIGSKYLISTTDKNYLKNLTA